MLFAFFAVGVCGAVYRQRALGTDRREQYLVFSAYLADEYFFDQLPGRLDPTVREQLQIVVEDETIAFWDTESSVFQAVRGALFAVLHGRTSNASARAFWDFILKTNLPTPVKAQIRLPMFRFPISVSIVPRVETSVGPDEFRVHFPDSVGYYVFSPVGFDFTQTEAYFFVMHTGILSNHEGFVLMRKRFGQWRVVREELVGVG